VRGVSATEWCHKLETHARYRQAHARVHACASKCARSSGDDMTSNRPRSNGVCSYPASSRREQRCGAYPFQCRSVGDVSCWSDCAWQREHAAKSTMRGGGVGGGERGGAGRAHGRGSVHERTLIQVRSPQRPEGLDWGPPHAGPCIGRRCLRRERHARGAPGAHGRSTRSALRCGAGARRGRAHPRRPTARASPL